MAWKNVQYENGKFKTGSGGGGGASTLTDLSDVNISSASDGQVLKYDSTSSKWVNANESGGGGHTYSTTEQVIGTWIDGKPLYEKTFWLSSRTAVTNDYTTIIISDTTAYNIKNIINATGYDNNGGADTDRVRLLTGNIDFILSNGNQLIAYTATNNTYQITGFTLQYTKTSDA